MGIKTSFEFYDYCLIQMSVLGLFCLKFLGSIHNDIYRVLNFMRLQIASSRGGKIQTRLRQ